VANREISRQLQGIKSLGAVFRYADCHDACRLLPLGLIVRAFLTTTLVQCPGMNTSMDYGLVK
jgi:hypothetical protein